MQRAASTARPPAEAAATEDWIATADAIVAEQADTVAEIVVEPVGQGAGGMQAYDMGCLAALRWIADRHDLLLVMDEIATGFGRGPLFAVEWAGVEPNVVCVGKALAGGYLTLVAVLCSGRVAQAITRSPQGALMRGPPSWPTRSRAPSRRRR